MNSKFLAAALISFFSCGPDLQPIEDDETDVAASQLSVNAASNWFPRDVSTRFVFERVGVTASRDVQLQVSNTSSQLTGLFDSPLSMTQSSLTVIQGRFPFDTSATSFLRFYGARSWTFGTGACSTFVVTRVNETEPLYSSAGIFSERRTFRFAMKTTPNVRCAQPAISELSFAAGVGLVSFKTGTGELFVRQSSSLVNGLTATLSLDKPSYANKPNSIRCIQAPCPSNAQVDVAQVKLTLKNTGPQAVTLKYTNGCFLNLVAVDSSGLVLRDENMVRSCEALAGQFTIPAKTSKVFTQVLVMEDLSGNQFEGGYSVYSIVSTSNLGNLIGSAAFHVGTR